MSATTLSSGGTSASAGTGEASKVSEGSLRGSLIALITPLLAVAAGWLAGAVAKIVPGAQLDKNQIVAFMVAAATAAVGAAWKWLQGWQSHEARVSDGAAAPIKAVALPGTPADRPQAPPSTPVSASAARTPPTTTTPASTPAPVVEQPTSVHEAAASAPPAVSNWWLLATAGPRRGTSFPLSSRNSIGWGEQATIATHEGTEDPAVEAIVLVTDRGVFVEPGPAASALLVNNAAIAGRQELGEGDTITVGTSEFELQWRD